jgi:hypothetical protein
MLQSAAAACDFNGLAGSQVQRWLQLLTSFQVLHTHEAVVLAGDHAHFHFLS